MEVSMPLAERPLDVKAMLQRPVDPKNPPKIDATSIRFRFLYIPDEISYDPIIFPNRLEQQVYTDAFGRRMLLLDLDKQRKKLPPPTRKLQYVPNLPLTQAGVSDNIIDFPVLQREAEIFSDPAVSLIEAVGDK